MKRFEKALPWFVAVACIAFTVGFATTRLRASPPFLDDDFGSLPNGVNPDLMMPAVHAAAVSLDDSTDLSKVCRAFICGTDGNVKVTTKGGEAVVLTGLKAGVVYPIRCSRIWSTSTTATGVTTLW